MLFVDNIIIKYFAVHVKAISDIFRVVACGMRPFLRSICLSVPDIGIDTGAVIFFVSE